MFSISSSVNSPVSMASRMKKIKPVGDPCTGRSCASQMSSANAQMMKKAVKEVANSKIKNANPDDFATYLAKRKAADEGRVWTPASGAAAIPSK